MTPWEVSFEVIQERNKNAGTIFLLCAFLNSSDLFYDLFQIGTNPNKLSQAVEAGDDPRPTWLCDLGREELAFLDVIKVLVFLTFSFLRPRESINDSYSIQAIVREWARLRLHASEWKPLLTFAVSLIWNALQGNDEREQSMLHKPLLPHADHCVSIWVSTKCTRQWGFTAWLACTMTKEDRMMRSCCVSEP